MPYAHDDWWYLGDILYSGFDENGHHTLWRGLKETILSHYNGDTDRIGNTLGVVMLLFPKWISAILASLAFICTYFLSVRLSVIRPGEWTKLSVLSFFLVFLVIWQDHMFIQMYIFNYIIILPLFLYAIHLFICNNAKIWLVCIFGLILGAWHESFAVTFIIGALTSLVFYPKLRNIPRIASVIATVIGMIWLFIFPGIYGRANSHLELSYISLFISLILLSLIIFLYFYKPKEKKSSIIYIFTFAPCFVLIPVTIATHTPRVLSPVLFLAACSLTLFIFSRFSNEFSIKSILSKIIALILYSLVIIHLVSVCFETIKIKDSIEDLLKQSFANKYSAGPVFFDAHLPKDYSVFSLNRPDYNFFEYVFFLNSYINRKEHSNPIPEELKEYREELGTPLNGSKYIKLWKGHLISSYFYDQWGGVDFTVEYKYWKEKCKKNTALFQGSDDKSYVYIFPRVSMFANFLGDPIGVYNAESDKL